MHVLPRSDDVLIDAIYGTLVGEMSWQALLDLFARDLPDGKATLHLSDTSGASRPFIVSTGVDESSLRDYAAYYGAINPMKFNCDSRLAGEGVLSEELIPYAQFSRTEYFDGFMRALNARSAMGVTIEREDFSDGSHCSFILSLLTSRNDAQENRPFARQLVRVAPHLRRAARAYRKGLFQNSLADVGATVLDAIDIGFVVCGDFGQVRFVSAATRRQDAEGRHFHIDIDGRLTLAQEVADQAFRSMLDRHYTGAKTLGFVHLDTRITLIRINKDRYSLYFEGSTVLVILEGTEAAGGLELDCQCLSLAYGLSKAEARVLRGLVQGHSIARIAAHHGRSPETVRTQVKGIYEKTGVRNRVDLVRLARPARAGGAELLIKNSQSSE